MSRRELGSGVWYDASLKGYAMLDVTEHIPPLRPTAIDGVTVYPKEGEFHVSIANLRELALQNPFQEAAMALFLRYQMVSEENRLSWNGFSGEYYVCHKPNEQGDEQTTVIASVEIIGLRALERTMRHTFDTSIRLSQPHVTLLKSANSPYGIGVNSPEALESLCERDDTLAERIFARDGMKDE